MFWWIVGLFDVAIFSLFGAATFSDYRRRKKIERFGVFQDGFDDEVFGKYKGYLVGLHRVRNENYDVIRWDPDPDAVSFIEEKIATGKAVKRTRSSYVAVIKSDGDEPYCFVKVDSGKSTCDTQGYIGSERDNDLNLSLYGEYEGETIPLRPVISMDLQCEIDDWILDPEIVWLMEREGKHTDGCSTEELTATIGCVIVDGSNVVFADDGNLVVGLKTCLKALKANKIKSFVFFDANIFHKLEEMENGEGQVAALCKIIDKFKGSIAVVPAGARADDFILKKADTDNCHILSNDRYKPYVERYPWIEQDRVHRFSFIDGRLMIPDLDIDVPNQ